jgi:hypothetical protein
MRRLSSKSTFFHKRVFPIFWFGFLAVFLVSALGAMGANNEFSIAFLIGPLVMAVFGYFFMKRLVFDLVDEVWDEGDALIVKNKRQEERIPLKDIINVSDTTLMNPPRITLTLRQPCRFGKEVTFSPVAKLFGFFSRNPVAIDLIERIDRSRKF